MIFSVLYTILLLAPIAIWWFKFKPKTLSGIPCWSNGHFFWGDLLRLQQIMKSNGSFTNFLDLSAKTLGPICQIRLGPFAHMVIVTDYLEVESLLLRRHQSLDRSYQTRNLFKTILPKALLTLKTGDVWRHHRKIIGSSMTPRFLALTTPNINKAAVELVELWKRKNKICKERSWAAETDLESATMDAICGIAFGESWGVLSRYTFQLDNLDGRTTSQMCTVGGKNEVIFQLQAPKLAKSTWYIFQAVPAQSPFPALTHLFTRLTPAYLTHTKRVNQFLERRLYQARQKAAPLSPDVADEMADNTLDLMIARELDGGIYMSDDEMRQELFQYLLAGTETTSTTLAWWCKFMPNNPSVQKKLRQHLLEHLPDHRVKDLKFEDLTPGNVPYLEAVVHETLRMARTAGGYLRDTKEDMIILGHHIPKGTTLAFPTSTGYEDRSSPIYASPTSLLSDDKEEFAIKAAENLDHLRQDHQPRRVGYWDSNTGNTFNPDRWLTEEGRFNAVAGPSLPFSLGQRRCFGKNLALLELRVFIAKLNLSFFFAPIPSNQNTLDRVDNVISHPEECFIRPVSWDSQEAA